MLFSVEQMRLIGVVEVCKLMGFRKSFEGSKPREHGLQVSGRRIRWEVTKVFFFFTPRGRWQFEAHSPKG